MKLRKFLTGLIGLILVTIIAASSTVFAEEVSGTQSAELKLSDNEIYEENQPNSNIYDDLRVHILGIEGFKCVEGKESTTRLEAVVRSSYVMFDHIPSQHIEWSTPNNDLISIKSPHSMDTTIVGIKPGTATVTLTVTLFQTTKSASCTINVAPKSGTGITNPGPTGPSTPSSSYNSNNEETEKVYRLYLATNNEPSILYSRGNNKF